MPTENRSINTDMVSEILPCPFCGQQDFLIERLDSDASVVICQGLTGPHEACLARGPVGVAQDEGEEQPGRDKAVELWNARAEHHQGEPVGEVVAFGHGLHEIAWAAGRMPKLRTKLYTRANSGEAARLSNATALVQRLVDCAGIQQGVAKGYLRHILDVLKGNPVPSEPVERDEMTGMVDAAMVEMANIHPPLKRSECERLIRAALERRP